MSPPPFTAPRPGPRQGAVPGVGLLPVHRGPHNPDQGRGGIVWGLRWDCQRFRPHHRTHPPPPVPNTLAPACHTRIGAVLPALHYWGGEARRGPLCRRRGQRGPASSTPAEGGVDGRWWVRSALSTSLGRAAVLSPHFWKKGGSSIRSAAAGAHASRGARALGTAESSAVLPTFLFGDFEAIPARHSVVPHRNCSVQRGMADRGIWQHNYSVGLACPTAKTTIRMLTQPSPGAVLAVINKFDKLRRGHAPSALEHDHCKHAMDIKAAASARHSSLIEMQGHLRIACIFAT